ncbi:ABC transporter substrate-binding protein [Plantactinospora soyae]|uniref:Raffinose/stachyose/melibiose transport system substrate-binding protein n=1 Tax=Plantactinospora soyae TaxID=1544732 RepID=A0A927QZP1_9ACTN|nr:extracellular solute-binding protein [Plantactinospora soyae]MBE1490635.1 raffinose/stachyose/melibiose transport system substrate-binding protein [Plantactinospora soyae]
MSRRIARLVAGLATTSLVAGCGLVGGAEDGRVEIEFFQFKSEAVQTFDKIIADFERERPDIRVVQNHVPDSETALRTRLVRDDIPDVMTLNGNASYAELARAGVFYDFSGVAAGRTVIPAILKVLDDLGTASPGEVNALPFASNASGVIYNKEIFAAHGVGVPETWEDLIAAAEKFRAARITPVYGTLSDSWTALSALNPIAANLSPDDYWNRLRGDQTSFRQGWPEVAQRYEQLFSYAQQDRLSRGYDDGNQAFAKGQAAMYVQGSWTIPAIRQFDPAFDLGVFPMPVGDARLVSGVDVAVTMPREPRRERESLAFVEYLMRPEVIAAYAEEQSAVPTLRGQAPADPALTDLAPLFEQGRIVGFPDHQIPPVIPLAQIAQQFLIDGDERAFLSTLDSEWNKFARRRK